MKMSFVQTMVGRACKVPSVSAVVFMRLNELGEKTTNSSNGHEFMRPHISVCMPIIREGFDISISVLKLKLFLEVNEFGETFQSNIKSILK